MPMKVTVCFDKVKVLVPCGDGELLVRELIEKAITRYKKAIGKSTDYWVSVHTVRTVNEDSILDPDDTLCDVVDDREQLIADFEEQGGPRSHHNGGDGQSVSSTGTGSPDIFAAELAHHKSNHHRGYSFDSQNDVIVTDIDISSGSGLTVRRGSEPALNVLEDENKPLSKQTNLSNRSFDDKTEQKKQDDTSPGKDDSHKPIIKGTFGQKEREKTPPFSRFARDSWRQSLGNQPNMFKWLEAQERQEERIKQHPERQGPVGGSTYQEDEVEGPVKPPIPPAKKEVGIVLCLKNDGTPLGIHVVPDFNEAGKESGLMVQGIEPGGRIDQDGRLKVQDRIIEINNLDLHNITFPKAQEIFRNAMKTDEVRLKVVKHSIPLLPKKVPPAVLPKPRGHSPTKPSPLTLPPQNLDINSPVTSPDDTSTPLEKTAESASDTKDVNHTKQNSYSSKDSGTVHTSSSKNTPSPSKKAPPPAPPQRHPSTTLSSNNAPENGADNNSSAEKSKSRSSSPSPSASGTLTKKREAIIAPTNTKKIGKRYDIELVKGPVGLGFSITTRDNPTGGPSPIYIKNILPKGAAVTDGRLKAGDRLLEVNGIEMTGKTQGDAVSILRNTTLGSTVHIVVSRQENEEEEGDDRFKVPRELHDSNTSDLDTARNDLELQHEIFQPQEKAEDDGTLAVMKNKELIEFNIPLNDTGSAGLGVSVKGKTLTTEEGTRDLGIFVKAVIHGGAASKETSIKDGRLQVNDQLLEVNSTSLINHANTEAMDLLRNAMQVDGPVPGCINIKVARRIGAPSPSPFASQGSEDAEWISGEKELNNNDSLDTSDQMPGDTNRTPEKFKNGDIPSNFKSPNLFLDRIMAGNGLRNESYTRATHESYVETPEPYRTKGNLIDLSKQRPRPHSTLGIERGSPPGSNSSSSEDMSKEPAWIHGPDWTRHASQTSEESELSPGPDGFSRDGFGRQSMSEKRKGHGDPRSSEIYQKVRGLKELNKGLQRSIQQSGSYGRLVRAGSADSLLSRSNSNINSPRALVHEKYGLSNIRGPAPPTNLKRFSSLENLSTMPDPDPDPDMSASFEDDEVSPQPRMARRRGGNESFRAAVDRSYDPVPKLEMDPYDDESNVPTAALRRSHSGNIVRSLSSIYLRHGVICKSLDYIFRLSEVEEEGSEGGSIGRDPTNSARSSTSEMFTEDGKKKGAKKHKDARKSGGLLKGFFKFGKGRKTPVDEVGKGVKPSDHKDQLDGEARAHREHIEQEEQRWRQAQAEQERAQQEYRWLQEQQKVRQMNLPDQPLPHGQVPFNPPEPHSMGHSAPVVSGSDLHRDTAVSRAERIQQLRADHQRRHQERQGQYPQEDREEEYERQIQEDEKKKYGQSAIPSQIEQQGQRSRPSSRNQVERPHSRIGSADFVQGTSNYQDYRDIQPQGTRLISDSNISKYSNFYRPPSRGQTSLTDMNFHHQNNQYHQQQQHSSVVPRGPTPSQDRQPQHPFGIQRGQTPTNEYDRNTNFRNANGSYQGVHRVQTPQNVIVSDRRNYAEYDDLRRGNMNVNRTNLNSNKDHVTRQEVLPPSGGNYSNSSYAYRDPVFTSVAGKRPVKSLSQQPNSAKV
ncbi:partitioning defective 3 homolog isoform X3 [Mercenaria mercenaria]|uniref:partitioning defective 3 homolog isoform X3 n=1 Tax=Mercenaria mercenaria TaxID=6596 RepID=UPI00234EB861|nr:partitioning defective 3 homolog isoform X3 [Mercenaria mercenaria]